MKIFGAILILVSFNLLTKVSFGCSCELESPHSTISYPFEVRNCTTGYTYETNGCWKIETCEEWRVDGPPVFTGYWSQASCWKESNFGDPEIPEDNLKNSPKQCGSVINVGALTVGEIVPLVGTNLSLAYHSDRVSGYKAGFTYKQNIDQGTSEPDLEKIHIADTYLGSGISNNHLPSVYPEHTFTWNGKDHSSNLVPSAINVELKVEYEHTGSVMTTEYVQNIVVGGFQAKALGLGGWTISNVHFYDPLKNSLYLGSGDTKSVVAYKVQETSGEFEIQDDSDPDNPPVFSHYLILSDDKLESYIFNSEGFHLKTISVEENETLLTVTYNVNNKIESLTDDENNEIEITRSGSVVTIEAPNGKQTTINLDVNGWAEEIIDPLNKKHEMTYSTDGLLLTFKNPEGLISSFSYDSEGLLEKDSNTAGHEITFDILSVVPNTNREISSTSKLGRVTNYYTNYN